MCRYALPSRRPGNRLHHALHQPKQKPHHGNLGQRTMNDIYLSSSLFSYSLLFLPHICCSTTLSFALFEAQDTFPLDSLPSVSPPRFTISSLDAASSSNKVVTGPSLRTTRCVPRYLRQA